MAFLRFVGKLLISMGAGILLFVAWTLWGTGLLTAREQERLAREFTQLPPLRTPPPVGSEVRGPPRRYAPRPGEPVFRLRMPEIGLDTIVVQGVEDDQLALGPGHYPACGRGFSPPLCTQSGEVWPGEQGRVIISGHRTTHGAPFWDLDKLERGDEVITNTRWGDFTYLVSGMEVVAPNAHDIANPSATNGYEIAFTTCNPKFSATQRLIVYARMTPA
jgi:sortase A